jgi:hypothetical protein
VVIYYRVFWRTRWVDGRGLVSLHARFGIAFGERNMPPMTSVGPLLVSALWLATN